jgi:hypothetical protein
LRASSLLLQVVHSTLLILRAFINSPATSILQQEQELSKSPTPIGTELFYF